MTTTDLPPAVPAAFATVFADAVFVLGTAGAMLSASALYVWWLVSIGVAAYRSRRPRSGVSRRERKSWPRQVLAAVRGASNDVDRARLASGLARNERSRIRQRVGVSVLSAVTTGGIAAALLSSFLDESAPMFVLLVVLGGMGAALVGQVGSLLAVVLFHRARARRDPLDAAAASVARAVSLEDPPTHGSRYWRRKGRLDAADAVHAAMQRAQIPPGDLAELRSLVGDNDDAWTRFRSQSLMRTARAYEGDFLSVQTSSDETEPRTRSGERRVAVLTGALSLGTALVGFLSTAGRALGS